MPALIVENFRVPLIELHKLRRDADVAVLALDARLTQHVSADGGQRQEGRAAAVALL